MNSHRFIALATLIASFPWGAAVAENDAENEAALLEHFENLRQAEPEAEHHAPPRSAAEVLLEARELAEIAADGYDPEVLFEDGVDFDALSTEIEEFGVELDLERRTLTPLDLGEEEFEGSDKPVVDDEGEVSTTTSIEEVRERSEVLKQAIASMGAKVADMRDRLRLLDEEAAALAEDTEALNNAR